MSALLPSMGVPHALRRQGRQGCSIKGRPALTPLHAQVWYSYEACAPVPDPKYICSHPDDLRPSGSPETDDSVSLVQWMEHGALGGRGLPVMRAWGGPFGAECAAILPPLTEAGLVLGATSRVALVETLPPCAQVKALGRGWGGGRQGRVSRFWVRCQVTANVSITRGSYLLG